MRNILQISVKIIFLLLWLLLAYKPWIRPEEYIKFLNNGRKKTVKNHESFTYSFFRKFPKLDLWFARIISLLGILICLIILLSSIF